MALTMLPKQDKRLLYNFSIEKDSGPGGAIRHLKFYKKVISSTLLFFENKAQYPTSVKTLLSNTYTFIF